MEQVSQILLLHDHVIRRMERFYLFAERSTLLDRNIYKVEVRLRSSGGAGILPAGASRQPNRAGGDARAPGLEHCMEQVSQILLLHDHVIRRMERFYLFAERSTLLDRNIYKV
jgi:hypothetical protein